MRMLVTSPNDERTKVFASHLQSMIIVMLNFSSLFMQPQRVHQAHTAPPLNEGVPAGVRRRFVSKRVMRREADTIPMGY
jgi:hypothetical protein